jgi:hypothetical protein
MDNEKVLFYLELLLIGVIVTGIVKRERVRLCRMFLLFLVMVFVTDIPPLFWPERFWNQVYYLVREQLHNVLRFAVLLEIAYYAFRSFPRGRSTAGLLLLLLLATTFIFVVGSGWEMSRQLPQDYIDIIGQVQVHQLISVVSLLLGITMLILWYRLRVDRMHRAILLGWVPYLILFSLGLRLAAVLGWNAHIEQVGYFTTGAYFLLLTYWARAAWAPAGAQALFRESVAVPARQAS